MISSMPHETLTAGVKECRFDLNARLRLASRFLETLCFKPQGVIGVQIQRQCHLLAQLKT